MLHLAGWFFRSHASKSSEFEKSPEAIQREELSLKDNPSRFAALPNPTQTDFPHSEWPVFIVRQHAVQSESFSEGGNDMEEEMILRASPLTGCLRCCRLKIAICPRLSMGTKSSMAKSSPRFGVRPPGSNRAKRSGKEIPYGTAIR